MYYNSYRKYNNKRTEYNGKQYMSKFEAGVAQELDLLLKAGEYVEIKAQYPIDLYVYLPNGEKVKIFKYICDFRCEKPDGSYVLVEAKGHETETFRIKKKILDLVWLPDHLDYTYEQWNQKSYRR